MLLSVPNVERKYPRFQIELEKVPDMNGLGSIFSRMFVPRSLTFMEMKIPSIKVWLVLDFGLRKNILKKILTAEEFTANFPPKRNLSGEWKLGRPRYFHYPMVPGDFQQVMEYAVATTKDIIEITGKPLSVCLVIKILAESCGISTYLRCTDWT